MFWAFVNKDYTEQILLNDELTWNSPNNAKYGDIVVIYTTSPQSNIGFIFKVISNPFYDEDIWKEWNRNSVIISNKIEVPTPISLQELNEDPILSKWAPVNKKHFKFQGSHFKMSKNEWNALKTLILRKNPNLEKQINEMEDPTIDHSFINETLLTEGSKQDLMIKWVFSVNKQNFNKIIIDDITWNSALDVKKGDWILCYSGEPESAITDIFIAKTDPYNTETTGSNSKNIDLHRITKIMDPLSWETLKNNPILKEWAGVKMHFGKSHFKTSEEVSNELKRLILEKNSDLQEIFNNGTEVNPIPKQFLIIKELYNEFETKYLPTPEGIEHSGKYDLERQKVLKYFEIIKNDANAIHEVNDPPINHLLPIKQPAVAPVAVGDIKAYGYNKEDLPGLTLAVKRLIDDLDFSKPSEKLKDSISFFKEGKYKKGFQTAMFTPTLYYIKPDFWFINRKTVATFNLFSDLLKNNEKISGNLTEYIDNNEKLHELVTKIKKYIPELDFESFDAFCHWMSSEDLGNYAYDKEKFQKWLIAKGFTNNGNKFKYNSFHEFLSEKNYLFTPETVENFLLSLKVKPFVILTGNSGTGKTKIAQLFAEYLETKNRGNHQIIPVGANWTENRHLIGFYNVITQNYQTTPSLKLLLEAVDDVDNPYLMILDEMNLSHVERYFADFLSLMESGESIDLHSNSEKELIVPETLEIPNNVLVVGTVNVDETTYMFSPKVLDRANTIEFSTYPAKNYILGQFEDNIFSGDVEYLENPLFDLENIRGAKINSLHDALKDVVIPDDTDLWTFLAHELNKYQEVLREASFDFGFRVIDEILRFMYAAWIYENRPDEWINWRRYFDAQIMQKMLPKIHGSQRELDVVLEKLFKLCYSNESDSDTWYSQELVDEYTLYPTSAKKLQWMGKTLQEKRFVSFTN